MIRVQFVASQLVGVVMARYILELQPFASLPVEQIAETIAPNLQRYLTGDLPGLTEARSRSPLVLVVVGTATASSMSSTGMPSSMR